MKKAIIKILFICVIVFVSLFLAAYFIFNIIGKSIIEKQLAGVFSAPATLKAASLRFPLSVSIKGLEIKDFLKADINVSVNPLSLLAGKIVLNNIVVSKPQLRVLKTTAGVVKIPLKENKQKVAPPIILGLDILDGKFTYIDESMTDYQVNIYDINVRVHKRGFNTDMAFNFNASADIGERIAKSGNFKALGWIDWTKKDMDGTLEISNLNTNYVVPFYKNILGDKASPATMDFKATMKAKNNDLGINCHMELAGLKKQAVEGDQPLTEKEKVSSVLGDIADIFSNTSGGKNVFDWDWHTNLDNPKLDKADLAQALIGNAAINILSRSPEENKSTFEKIGDKIKDLGGAKGSKISGEDIEGIINIFKK